MWDYKEFDPLRTAEEYQASHDREFNPWNSYQSRLASVQSQFANPASYLPSNEQMQAYADGDQSQSWSLMPSGFGEFKSEYGAGWTPNDNGTVSFAGGTNRPAEPDTDLYNSNVNRLRQNQQMQQGAYDSQMGGGWSGGVLPGNMAETLASGGQFKANPSSGVRPSNPFQQTSYNEGSAGASFGGGQAGAGGLGGLGGLGGGTSPFNLGNPYI